MITGNSMDHFSIHRLEKTWTHYGFDAPSIIGFLCGAALVKLSSSLIKRLIYNQVELTLERLPQKTPPASPEEREKEKCEIHKIFDWQGAELIGILECFLYVYAVLEVPAWPLMAGWLAMKAFFIRLAEPHELEPSRRQSIYHLYLFGNIISVLAGLICGHIARAISTVNMEGVLATSSVAYPHP